jgi:hypothetical protein
MTDAVSAEGLEITSAQRGRNGMRDRPTAIPIQTFYKQANPERRAK